LIFFLCPDWLLVISFLISHSFHYFYSSFTPLPFSLFFTPKLVVISTLCYLCFVIFWVPIYLCCGVLNLMLYVVCILLLLMLCDFLTICALVVFCIHIFCSFNCFHFFVFCVMWFLSYQHFGGFCALVFCCMFLFVLQSFNTRENFHISLLCFVVVTNWSMFFVCFFSLLFFVCDWKISCICFECLCLCFYTNESQRLFAFHDFDYAFDRVVYWI